jgi:hypothetical protein
MGGAELAAAEGRGARAMGRLGHEGGECGRARERERGGFWAENGPTDGGFLFLFLFFISYFYFLFIFLLSPFFEQIIS